MKLFKTFSLYTFVGFLNAGLGFLLLPVLTRYLTPEDYGIISLVSAYVAILIPFVGLSTASFLTIEYYNKNVSKEEFRQKFSSVRSIPLFTVFIFFLIFAAGAGYFPSLMELPATAYWLILPLTLFSLYQENFQAFMIATKRANLYSVFSILKVISEIALTLLLVVYIGKGWDGRILSSVSIAVVFTLISIFYYRKWNLLVFTIKKKYIRQAIVFGSPLILHQIGKFVINQSDRLFLAKLVSVNEMGVYSVGYQVGMIVLIIVTAFTNFFAPFLYERLKAGSENGKKEVIKVSYLFFLFIIGVLTVLTFASDFLFRFFIDGRYSGGQKYVFWIGLSYVFWAVYIIFAGYIQYFKKTRVLGYAAILNVLLNCGLNYFLIKEYGPIGAAYATCISFFIVCVLVAYVSNRLYPMPWLSFFKKNQL